MAQDQPAVEGDQKASDSAPIVAFDFDGTLTVRDSFLAFLKWRQGPRRYVLGLGRLIPAALAYLVHRDRGRIKAAAVREFLRGVSRERLVADAQAFAELFSGSLLRPDALETWNRWRSEPVRLVIVTASPDLTVAPFAQSLGADALLGTQLAFDIHDRVAGGLASPNCRGQEKVRRMEGAFGPDFELKAAYGDTRGDLEMLARAQTSGYRIFKRSA